MKLFIRADASVTIGTGHIFRTLVLAQNLKGYEITYFCRDYQGLPKKRIVDSGFKLQLIPQHITVEIEKELILSAVAKEKPDWMIIDNYAVKENYYVALNEAGIKIMAIDDINHTRFPVDILLNQNILAQRCDYICEKETIKLLGPQYALINPIYNRKREEAKIRNSLKKVLIFMGGADPRNETLKMLNGIKLSKKDLTVEIVIGNAFQFKKKIQEAISHVSFDCHLHEDIPNLADLMLISDLAIGAGGIATWEMCSLFLPMILTPIADNQMEIAKGLSESGSALSPGPASILKPSDLTQLIDATSNHDLSQMSQKAGSICDGNGTHRVANYFN